MAGAFQAENATDAGPAKASGPDLKLKITGPGVVL
jgi:hypothetical protein